MFFLKTTLKIVFISKSFTQVSQTNRFPTACVVHSVFVYVSEIPDMIDFPAPNPVLNLSFFLSLLVTLADGGCMNLTL